MEAFSEGINMAVYRKIMIDGGKYGIESKSYFRKYTEAPFILYLALNSVVLGVGILIYILPVKVFLDRFLPSFTPLIILGFGYMIYTTRTFLNFYLNVTDQLHKWLKIILLGLGLNVVLDYSLLASGYGLSWVAGACSFSFLFVSAMTIVLSFNQIYGKKGYAIGFIIKISLISGILVALIAVFNRWNVFAFPSLSNITSQLIWGSADMIIKATMLTLICAGAYLTLFKEFELHKELKPILSYLWTMRFSSEKHEKPRILQTQDPDQWRVGKY